MTVQSKRKQKKKLDLVILKTSELLYYVIHDDCFTTEKKARECLEQVKRGLKNA